MGTPGCTRRSPPDAPRYSKVKVVSGIIRAWSTRIARRPYRVCHPPVQNVQSFRASPGCTAAVTALSTVAGAYAGASVLGPLLAPAGAAAGAPGGPPGAAAGVAAAEVAGAAAGGAAGHAIAPAVSNIMCSSGTGSGGQSGGSRGGGSGQRENRAFKEAVRRINQDRREPLTPDQVRALHDEIPNQGFSLDEIVEIGKGMFRN